MYLSIIIPAYDEEHKISGDIAAADQFQASIDNECEILIVDDGSSDTTATIAAESAEKTSCNARVISIPHGGKGMAVREGIVQSSGRVVMFADSGLCVDYNEAITAIEMIEKGECLIANGTRYSPESVIVRKKGFFRQFASALFRTMLPKAVGLNGRYTDTQCGFKVYDGTTARSLYQQCKCAGYFFDLEVILRAELAGFKIREFPVKWTSDEDSRLSLLRSLFNVYSAVRQIRKAVKPDRTPHDSEEVAINQVESQSGDQKQYDRENEGSHTPEQ